VDEVRVQFPTERGIVRAVDGVSFHIRPGEILGIVGESGSGKTITARAVLRIVPPPGKVVTGRILLRGRELLSLSEREMAQVRGREIAMIFQEPGAALNPVFTVGEQIAEALQVHRGLGRRQARERSIEFLREVGIPAPEERYRSYPHQLSGGMQQRCMIAIALACGARLLIADEPTTALDVTVQAQILDLLVRLTREHSVGMMFITHNIAAVAQIAHQVMVMYAGRIMETGPIAQVIDAPKHPYTQALLQAMPTMTVARGQRLLEIQGRIPDLSNVPPGCPFHPRCPFAMDQCAVRTPSLQTVAEGQSAACLLYDQPAEVI